MEIDIRSFTELDVRSIRVSDNIVILKDSGNSIYLQKEFDSYNEGFCVHYDDVRDFKRALDKALDLWEKGG